MDNDKDVVTIAIINTYLAFADDDYDDRNGEVDLTVYGIKDKGSNEYVKTTGGDDHASFDVSEDDFYIENVVDGDSFLVTVAEGEVQSMAQPEVIEAAEVSSFRIDNNVVVDGTKYNFSSAAEYDHDTLDSWTNGGSTVNLKDSLYDVYLDQYGYAIGVKVVDEVNNYLFITGIDRNASNLNNRTADANVIFLDGTMDTVEINMTRSDLELKANYDNSVLNTWCTYTVNSNGVYTVHQVSDLGDSVGGQYGDDGGTTNLGTPDDSRNDANVAQYHKVYTNAESAGTISDTRTSAPGNNSGAYSRVYGNDNSVYLVVELAELDAQGDGATSNNYGVINDVTSVITGIDNANLTVWKWTDARDEAENEPDPVEGTIPANDFRYTSNGIYTLYDEDGYVIAAIVVGEDAGSSKNLVYAHTGTVESEGYDRDTDTWSWSRMVVADGVETEIRERGDSLTYLDNMQQNAWYQVKYDAEGYVIDVTSYLGQPDNDPTNEFSSDWAVANGDITEWDLDEAQGPQVAQTGDFVTDINDLETAYNENDNVLYYQHFNRQGQQNHDELVLIGRTLYVTTTSETGFRVAEDVNVVLQRNTRNTKWNTTFYSGVDELEDVIDDLNSRGETLGWSYFVSAVIEDGAATTVVIRDRISDYETPEWGEPTSDLDEVILVANAAADADRIDLLDANNAPLMGTDLAWALEMRGPGQATFDVALDGSDVSNQTTGYGAIHQFIAGFEGGTSGNAGETYSFRLVVDSVPSNTITIVVPAGNP